MGWLLTRHTERSRSGRRGPLAPKRSRALHGRQGAEPLPRRRAKARELDYLPGHLADMVVHDLKAPLMGVIGYLQVLQMRAGGRLDPEETRLLDRALRRATDLAEMVHSLLDASRLEAGALPLHLATCDLSAVARDAVEVLGSLADASPVRLQVPPEPVLVSCDRQLIRRVISNLLLNALQHTPDGGEVHVVAEEAGAMAKVAVTDTGPGIPPEARHRLFDRFARVEARTRHLTHATGLGLAFCRLAVAAHGGAIGVESEVGRGSTFWFVLPLGPGVDIVPSG